MSNTPTPMNGGRQQWETERDVRDLKNDRDSTKTTLAEHGRKLDELGSKIDKLLEWQKDEDDKEQKRKEQQARDRRMTAGLVISVLGSVALLEARSVLADPKFLTFLTSPAGLVVIAGIGTAAVLVYLRSVP